MLLCSCTKSPLGNEIDSSVQGGLELIGWSVSADSHADASANATRALVENYAGLRDACTQFEYQEAEKIGLLGKYTSGGKSKVVFDNVDLWWWEKPDGNPYDDQTGAHSRWNCSGDPVYWADDADYTFKAYFPKSKVQLQPGSGADMLLAVYDSQTAQYDLLVSHRALRSYAENPVNLNMKHALAALKFDFQFVDLGVTDNLISCWLENHSSDGFYTSSTLNFEEDIVWPKSTANPVGTALYYWEPFTPMVISSDKAVTAYSTAAAVGNGSVFTENRGWLLVIPQSNTKAGTLKLCFRTSTGGNAVYRADLPSYDFRPGYRYNYHIKMTSTEVKVSLTIAEWNKRNSSYEIDFNN